MSSFGLASSTVQCSDEGGDAGEVSPAAEKPRRLLPAPPPQLLRGAASAAAAGRPSAAVEACMDGEAGSRHAGGALQQGGQQTLPEGSEGPLWARCAATAAAGSSGNHPPALSTPALDGAQSPPPHQQQYQQQQQCQQQQQPEGAFDGSSFPSAQPTAQQPAAVPAAPDVGAAMSGHGQPLTLQQLLQASQHSSHIADAAATGCPRPLRRPCDCFAYLPP